MAGYFQLKSASSGKWMFNLRAGNHETILTSESYTTKQAAQAGIDSVRKNSANDAAFVRKTASNGSPYFVLTSEANGQTVGKSEMYGSPASMEGGIASVKANAPKAEVKEV
jgi:uncharacterized protein YegP (UPF0339 family)